MECGQGKVIGAGLQVRVMSSESGEEKAYAFEDFQCSLNARRAKKS
jgi:hypothetical protein